MKQASASHSRCLDFQGLVDSITDRK